MLQDAQPNGGAETAGSPSEREPDASSQPVASKKKARPKKTLPTERIAFPKQLDILRAHAVESNEGEKPATNIRIAAVVKMNHGTVSLANPFFVDSNLLVKSNGSHLPVREVIEYSRATQWGDEQAGHKLAPRLRDTWFGQRILRRLAFSPVMDEEDALRELAQDASAPPAYRPQVALLLSYLEIAGLIERDGTQIRRGDPASSGPQPAALEPEPTPVPEHDPLVPPNPLIAPQGEGAVTFQIGVQVDLAELRDWDAQRISSFFAGMAQVLAAKSGLEQPNREA
jgi:hypothetical protein